jgi:acyl-CoA thioester hydrolase
VSREFLWRAPAWQADLDAFGDLRNASLLRLLQEAATRASTAAGFDAAYYERAGLMWLVRRTTLTRLAPVRYGDELAVSTWIADFRRVRSQREYEVRNADRAVALASSDWVMVDRAQGRPRRIPVEWQAAFPSAGPTSGHRVPFREREPPTSATTLQRRIELHDLDALRHVNNANYVSYLEQAALDALAAVGWDLSAQLAAGGRLAATMHDLEYLDAALYGEVVEITTWVTAVDAHGLERHTHLHRGNAHRPLLHARSRYDWVGDEASPLMPAVLRTALGTP